MNGEGMARELAALIPRLRRYARALTRNADAADDLVQEPGVKATSGSPVPTCGPGCSP